MQFAGATLAQQSSVVAAWRPDAASSSLCPRSGVQPVRQNAVCTHWHDRRQHLRDREHHSRRQSGTAHTLATMFPIKVKVKEVHLYSAILWAPHLQCAQVWITQFYLQITPYLSLHRNRSPDGATIDCGGWHLIVAYYSFINLNRTKGWIGLVGWPIKDGLPT